jgi:hypothetical protein
MAMQHPGRNHQHGAPFDGPFHEFVSLDGGPAQPDNGRIEPHRLFDCRAGSRLDGRPALERSAPLALGFRHDPSVRTDRIAQVRVGAVLF